MVMPVLSGSADGMGTQDDLSDRSSYAADVLTFDEFSYDDPRLFVVFAALSVIVLYLLYREIKKHGIYSEEFRKGSDRVYCPECGNEISAEDEFCPVCGYRPTKRRSFLRGSAARQK